MTVKLTRYYNQFLGKVESWSQSHLPGIFIFNILVILLLLLRSGGYFDPYFTITINVVIFVSLISSVVLLGVRSKTLFLIALIFWFFAGILRFLGIEVWAERTTLYTFQALLIGVVLMVFQRNS